MKKYLPFLLVLLVLLVSAYDYHRNMEQARENFRQECHLRATQDLANLEEGLRQLQSVFAQMTSTTEISAAVNDGSPTPPGEVNSLVGLLSERLQIAAFYVLQPDPAVLWRIVVRWENFKDPLEQEGILAKLTSEGNWPFQKGSEDDNLFVLGSFPLGNEGPGFLCAVPIRLDFGEQVGVVTAFVPCSSLTKRLSPGVFAVRETESNLLISVPQFLGEGTIYKESLKSDSLSWEVQTSRPDSEFWERSDVRAAKRSAAVSLLSLFLSVMAALLWYRHRQRLAQARYRSVFMGTLSHEAHRFLDRIAGWTRMSSEVSSGKMQQELLASISRSADALTTMVEDNSDMACIEADAITLQPRFIDLRALLHRTTASVAQAAGNKGVALICWVDATVPHQVQVDEKRLSQALHCLLDNAVKFTDSGEISLRVVPTSGGLRFAIRDSGPGIPQEHFKTIFRPFQQLAPRPGENPPGAGLGLAICSNLVHQMGGELEVESSTRRGSVFWFTLPLKGEPPEPWELPEELHQARLVVLEEQDTHHRRLKSILKSVGLEHERAVIASSLETLGEPAGLLITQPTKTLFELELKGWKILVVIEPGPRAERQAARYRERGCEVLWKPYSERELLDKLGAMVVGEAYTPIPEPKLEPVLPHLKLILAESDPLYRAYSLRWLNATGQDVTLTDDGQTALELAQKGNLDLLVLTLPLKNLDGLELIRKLRGWEKRQGRPRLPVLVLLPSELGRDRGLCLKAGADAVMAKPFDRFELQIAIRSILSETVMERPRATVVPRANTLIFEPDLALEEVGGDPDTLRETIEMAMETAPNLLGRLKEAHSKQDQSLLEGTLKGLRCLAETFVCDTLSQQLAVWETDPWEQSFEELDQLVRELIRALKEFKESPLAEGGESEDGLPAVSEGGSGLKPLRATGKGSIVE